MKHSKELKIISMPINMNGLFKVTIQILLKQLAKIYILRTKPYIIVVAGTVGRHWIKEAIIKALLDKKLSARGNQKNFNAEIGIPLSILGLPSGKGNFWKWLKVLWQAIKKVSSFKFQVSSEYLVLETAIDRPGNMNYLLSIIKPQVAVITAITMIYRENFEDLDEISEEYKKIVKSLPVNGLAVLNNDDKRVNGLSSLSNAEVITYGLENGADFTAKNIKKLPDGQSFEIHQSYIPRNILFRHLSGDSKRETSILKIKINRFGQHHIYAALVKKIINEKIC